MPQTRIRQVTPQRGKLVTVDGYPARVVEVPKPENEGGKQLIARLIAPPGMPLKEAREKALDFWHPKFGWLRSGYKFEIERPLTPAETQGLAESVTENYDLDLLAEFDPENDVPETVVTSTPSGT